MTEQATTYRCLSYDTVRGRYCDGTHVQTGHTTDGAEYDRWLAGVKAGVKAEAKAEALNEAAGWVRDNGGDLVSRGIEEELTYRANQYKGNQ